MPGMDRTGPMGTGPIGRRMGPCGNGQGGHGRGNGFNSGNRSGWTSIPTDLTPDEEQTYLEQQKERLESQLEMINKKLEG